MIVPLKPTPFTTALPYPTGLASRDLPLMNAVVESPAARINGSFLVDTGADSVVFPLGVARLLQIDLSLAPSHSLTIAGSVTAVAHYAQTNIEIAFGHAQCRWRTWVAFAPVRHWLFGHFGGLEHFHFTLDIVNEEFILVPRDSLPRV